MADSIKLRIPIWGNTNYKEYELAYDESTQDEIIPEFGLTIPSAITQVNYHTPVDGEPEPVNAKLEDRLANFQIIVKATAGTADSDKNDYVQNIIAELKRGVHGKESIAYRHWSTGLQEPSYLRVQLDGQTNYTDIPVKIGHINDGEIQYGSVSNSNKVAFRVPVSLTLSPYGLGEEIELFNIVPKKADMMEDSDGDGVPDGLIKVGVSPIINQFDEVNYLFGGQSFVFQPATAATGYQTYSTTADSNTVSAYVWLYVGGNEVATIQLYDQSAGAAVLEKELTATDANSVSDKSLVSSNGLTWYRVVFDRIGITNGNLHHIRVLAKNNNDTINVQCFYMRYGNIAPPSAYMSTSRLLNRGDTDYDPDNFNFIDVWGVHGDEDAIITELKIDAVTVGSSSVDRLVATKIETGKTNVKERTLFVSSTDMSTGTGTATGTWSEPSDASRAGGNYRQFVATGSGNRTFSWTPSTVAIDNAFNDTPVRVFLIAWSDDTNTTVELFGSSADYQTETINFASASAWQILDLGVIMQRKSRHSLKTTAGTLLSARFTIANTKTFRVDGAFVMPVYDSLFMAQDAPTSASENAYLLGETKEYFWDGNGTNSPYLGDLWMIRSGQAVTRIPFLIYGTGGVHNLDDSWDITLKLRPRTSHLLGTK